MEEESRNIVLVDDDDTNNFICRRMLHIFDPQIQIVEFIDPEEALHHLRKEGEKRIKLLLLDINMPKINAWQFLEHLGNDLGDSDIILLTSSIDPKDRLRAKQIENVKGFWTKPLSLDMISEYFSNDYSFYK